MHPTHIGKDNVYVFYQNDRKIVLSPIKNGSVPKAFKVEQKSSIFLVNNDDEFEIESKESK
jgi:hypothetical protein